MNDQQQGQRYPNPPNQQPIQDPNNPNRFPQRPNYTSPPSYAVNALPTQPPANPGLVTPLSPPTTVNASLNKGSGTNPKRRQYPTAPQNMPAQYDNNPSQYDGQQMFVPGAVNQLQSYPNQTTAPNAYSQQQFVNQPQDNTQNYDPNSLINPMANMSMQQTGLVQQPIQTVPLLHFEPKMDDLNELSPKINLPNGVAVNSASPYLHCDPGIKRSTLNAVPATPALLKKSNLPLGLVITPFKSAEPEDHVPVVYEINRCRACRTYINPFVTIIQTKWKCNVCDLHNDLPQSFDYDLTTRQSLDRYQRPELNCATVDYSAPVEYMVRAPHPPIYVFVIDVSYAAVQNGMLAAVSKTILESLDLIPNPDQRVKVGFLTVDSALHYYKLSPGSTEPQMLVVADLEEIYLPQPEDLLVNLVEARATIDALLSRLGLMFKSTQNVASALGPALHAAQKLLLPSGGKIISFQTIMPTIKSGDMITREDPKVLGTPKESALLNPATSYYKNFALDCTRAYIGVDLFLFGQQYMDLATLTSASKFTGGSVFHYPTFNLQRSEDLSKLRFELTEFLSREIGLEAVLRLRCSRGLRANAYYGNYFLRATQLLSLPNVTPDHCYTVELAIDEKLESTTAVFQTALLYTTITGERRIRVITMVLPTTSSISEIYQSADQTALATFITKKAVDRALTSKLEDARDAVVNKCAEILNTFKTELTSSQSGATSQLPITANLRHFPLLTLAMLKHISLKAGSTTSSDLRSFAINTINLAPPELLLNFLVPKFYSLHNLDPEVGTVNAEGHFKLPLRLNLRSENLSDHGVYLLDTGHRALVYVGSRAHPDLLRDLFSAASYGSLLGGKSALPLLNTKVSKQTQAILHYHRKLNRNLYYQELFVIKEDGDPALRMLFNSYLVEDRSNSTQSYHQFVTHLKEMVNSGKI